MRVLHVVESVDATGVGAGPLAVALNDCQELARRGIAVALAGSWCGRSPTPRTLAGINAFLTPASWRTSRVGAALIPNVRLLVWLCRRRADWDVIHLHCGRSLDGMLVLVVARLFGVPIIVQTHGMIGPDPRLSANVFDTVLTRPLLRRAACVLHLTERERRNLSAIVGPRLRLIQIPNGVPEPATSPTCEESDEVDILYLARLQERKRPLVFVEAAARILNRGVRARFSIVGPDGGQLDATLSAIEEFGIGKSVCYEGVLRREEVPARMRRASVYVLPSVDEPFPMSLLEAMSLGIPSICTTECGLAQPLAEAKAALVVEPTVSGLVRAIDLVVADHSLRQELSRAGLAVVRKQFSIRRVVDQLLEQYLDAVKRANPWLVSQGNKG